MDECTPPKELLQELVRLRKQIAELEKRDLNHRRLEEKLRESEAKYQTITNAATAAIIMMDGGGKISFWNPAAERIFGYSKEEALGRGLHQLLSPNRYYEQYQQGFERFKKSGKGSFIRHIIELTAVRRDGTRFPIGLSLSAIKIKDEWHAIGIVRDITERKQAEEALRKAHDELEKRVQERTVELQEANRQLAEVNSALKVLLHKSREARCELEGNMLSNVEELVMPYLDELALKISDRPEKVYLEIIKNNLRQITSSFSQNLISKFRGLTPKEINVADLIKQGRSTKEIAELLHVSCYTIDTYRANLRKKLGIKNQKINLRSFLQSLHD
jgi:PAS domain S-box-containing protein